MNVLNCSACILLIGMLGAYVYFLLSMSRVLSLCSRRNLTMAPGLVWLALIPFFHVVWLFVIVVKVASSLKNEFRDRGIENGSSYGRDIGLTTCVVYVASIVLYQIGRVSPEFNLFVSLPFGFIVLGCWVAYWVQVTKHAHVLNRTERHNDADDY
jgi:hypothetical protein